MSQPTLPPLPARPSDPLAALADYLDPPDARAYVEVGWPAAAAIVAEVLAARAVVDNARFVGREDLDETDVAERLAGQVDAYDRAVATVHARAAAAERRRLDRLLAQAREHLAAKVAADDQATQVRWSE